VEAVAERKVVDLALDIEALSVRSSSSMAAGTSR